MKQVLKSYFAIHPAAIWYNSRVRLTEENDQRKSGRLMADCTFVHPLEGKPEMADVNGGFGHLGDV